MNANENHAMTLRGIYSTMNHRHLNFERTSFFSHNNFELMGSIGCSFNKLNMINTGFMSANLEGSRFISSILNGVNFHNANLKGAEFKNDHNIDIWFSRPNLFFPTFPTFNSLWPCVASAPTPLPEQHQQPQPTAAQPSDVLSLAL